jgi:hypothetical protein
MKEASTLAFFYYVLGWNLGIITSNYILTYFLKYN